MFVNCQPARRLCLPDLAPAQAIVRAGERTGERWGDAELLPSRAVGLAVLAGRFALARVWHRGSVAALPLRTVGIAFLSRRFALARGWHCGSGAALFLGSRSAVRFWRGALSSRAVGLAVLAGRLSSVHACCLSCDKQDGLRYLAFLFRRVEIAIRAFSRCRCGYLP